jgi:hypothetical protein
MPHFHQIPMHIVIYIYQEGWRMVTDGTSETTVSAVSKEQKVHNVGKSETPLTAVSENRR